ncbi:MAG: hypothetical protein NC115_00240 [Bacteroidales bacterium]|nr:hypothetical protein [Bacteroidales bacterium]
MVPMTFNSYDDVQDIIEDGINDCLIDSFNIKAYANKLVKLMSDDNFREELACNAKMKSDFFSINEIGKKWLKLFNDL